MNNDEIIAWEDVETPAARMFNVWCSGAELAWAKECWGHFEAGGLTGCSTVTERTETLLRLVTLARIYEEFCGYAWDENPETPVDYLAEDLEIDQIALGILAGAAGKDFFEDACEEHELHEAALMFTTDQQRKPIFDCLCLVSGGPQLLYARMSQTNQSPEEKGDEFEVTGNNCCALQFVQEGFPP